MALTIFGGSGFVGREYVKQYYHHAIGNIASVNSRNDPFVYSEDILYLISTVHNYHVFDDPQIDIDTNLKLLVKTLDYWKIWQEHNEKHGVFNFASSWSVYGNQERLPVAETAVCYPKGFYIITKHCAEQLLISYCETFNLKYRILRFANIVGPGDTKASPQKNVLQHSINLLKEGKDVELFGDGKFYRDFMHVSDCANAVEWVLAKGKTNEIYNIGNGDPIFYYAAILEYAKVLLNSSGNIVFKEPTDFQKKVPVSSFYMDVSKLHKLGFHSELTGTRLYKAVILGE